MEHHGRSRCAATCAEPTPEITGRSREITGDHGRARESTGDHGRARGSTGERGKTMRAVTAERAKRRRSPHRESHPLQLEVDG